MLEMQIGTGRTIHDDILPFINYRLKFFELHGIVGGKCTCGNEKCGRNSGKHPRTEHGYKDAREYKSYEFASDSNVGIPTGQAFATDKYLYVVDVDPRNGGYETLSTLFQAYGKFPPTWSVETGGGGEHFYFYAKHVYKSNKTLNGIDLQGFGAYVVGPGSTHMSGLNYTWIAHPEDYDLAPLPEWIEEIYQQRDVPKDTNVIKYKISKLEYEEILRYLQMVPPNTYKALIECGMALKATGWDIIAYQAWKTWAAQNTEKYNDAQMWPKWCSFKGQGITKNTIKMLAGNFAHEIIIDEIIIKENVPPRGQHEGILQIGQRMNTSDSAVNSINVLQMSSGIVREIADNIKSNAFREYDNWAIAAALSILSAVFQQRYLTPIGHPLSLYQIIPGYAAQGKDDYLSAVRNMIEQIEPRLAMAPSSSSAGLIGEQYAFNSRIETLDEFQDNLGKMTKSDNPHIKEKLTNYKELYNNTKYIAVGATKLQGSVKVYNPKLTLLCFGTPKEIATIMSGDNIGGGLISRFMQWPVEVPSAGKNSKDKVDIPHGIIAYLKAEFKKSLSPLETEESFKEREKNYRAQTIPAHSSAFLEPKKIGVTDAAKIALDEFFRICDTYYCQQFTEPDAASVDRSYGLALRVATIHALGCKRDLIDMPDVVFGIAVAKLCCSEICKAIDEINLDAKDRELLQLCDRVHRYLVRKGGHMKKKDLLEGIKLGNEKIKAILSNLEAQGRVSLQLLPRNQVLITVLSPID